MKKRLHLFIVIIINLFGLTVMAQSLKDLESSLPLEINGWKQVEEDRLFDNESLYDYIDGSAEMFLSFGFSNVFNRIYSRDNQPDIIVDIFHMNSSYDAYGVFSHSVGKIENELGQQSQRTEGAIIFWKNNYYISILCHPETDESKQTIYELAKIIDKSIIETGSLPPVLKYFPKENLISESIRYFRHYNWLNSHKFISNDNILNIEQNTHGLLARYTHDNDNAILLIVLYPDNVSAEKALNKFVYNYDEKLLPNEFVKTGNGLWANIKRTENFIIGIFDSTNKEFAEKILVDTKTLIKRK